MKNLIFITSIIAIPFFVWLAQKVQTLLPPMAMLVNDTGKLRLTINASAIPTQYTSIIVSGTPFCQNLERWTINTTSFYLTSNNLFPDDDSRAAFINNGFTLRFVTDSFAQDYITGTFIVYGIK